MKKSRYTFADVLAWDEKDRIEIIDGEAVMMSPPSRIHQKISGELFRQLANYLEGKKCEVYPAPFGVRLFEQDGDNPEDVDTVVEPDITVICDKSKLDKYGCKGAPDLIIEILSTSTQRHDRLVKLGLYQRAGVREYWTVNPADKTVQVMLRDDNGVLQLHEVYGGIVWRRSTPWKVALLNWRKFFLNDSRRGRGRRFPGFDFGRYLVNKFSKQEQKGACVKNGKLSKPLPLW